MPSLPSDRKEWAKHLTPELREHFERVGPSAVEFDAFHHRYSADEKRMAALEWLAEQREKKEHQETVRFRLIFWTALATLIVTLVAALATELMKK